MTKEGDEEEGEDHQHLLVAGDEEEIVIKEKWRWGWEFNKMTFSTGDHISAISVNIE